MIIDHHKIVHIFIFGTKKTENTLQRRSNLCIPIKDTSRPRSLFLHSCICEGFIYSHDWSYILLQQSIGGPIVHSIHSVRLLQKIYWEQKTLSELIFKCGNWVGQAGCWKQILERGGGRGHREIKGTEPVQGLRQTFIGQSCHRPSSEIK